MKNKLICLIRNKAVSIRKKSNIERHYDTKHASIFEKFKGQFNEDEMSELRCELSGGHSRFKNI